MQTERMREKMEGKPEHFDSKNVTKKYVYYKIEACTSSSALSIYHKIYEHYSTHIRNLKPPTNIE